MSALSLGVLRSLDLVHLMRLLNEMHRSFAALQFKLRSGTEAQIAAMLKNGKVDLAVGGPMGVSWEWLESWPMFSEAFDLVAGIDHPLATHNDLDVKLIRDTRLLIYAGTDMAEFNSERLGAVGINRDHAHEVNLDRDLEALVVAEFGGPPRALDAHQLDRAQ